MEILADTNIFLAVALNEPERERIIRSTVDAELAAPEILPYEVGNALSAMYKRSQLTGAQALAAHRAVEAIPVRLVTTEIQAALEVALEFNIYAYDAYFLQCARTLSTPLLTLDNRMRQVAAEMNIPILE